MLRYDRKFRSLALGFAMLAGFVDAAGFIKSGGLFVSFMSGNSTRLAISLATLGGATTIAAGLIAIFVAGVMLAVLICDRVTGVHRKVMVAGIVAALLLLAAAAQTIGWDAVTIGLLCVGMGASNAMFQRDGEVAIGVTYMTGTLVKIGYKLADAVRGRDLHGWIPYLLLWSALVSGGVAGALAFVASPTLSLWGAALLSAALFEATRRLTRIADECS
jgi:uncharacterized membrane protein YoaK (UPF0700 family)